MKADAICEVVIYRFDSFKKKILIDIGTIGIKLPFLVHCFGLIVRL